VVNNGVVARMTLHRAKRYVVSSDFQRRELAHLGYRPEQVCVVPNLIDEYKLKRWDQDAARGALGLPSGPLVAFVGHYHDVKGHDVLIRAFPAVLEKVPDARLVLAWSGIGHRSRVQAAIAEEGIGDRVIELGRLDVAQLFSAVDVAALPYRFTIGQAAYPGTVIEAMWVGVPLVTSDLPLLAELSDQGTTALLARPGDASDVARQVVRALTEPSVRRSLVDAQRAAVATRFHAAARIDDYVAIYREAITGQANLLQPARN
jgi:glycosyltransferase involved in cell wall biosynthesis